MPGFRPSGMLWILFLLPLSPAFGDQLEEADLILEDVFTVQGVTARQPRTPDGHIDWRWRGPKKDKEWAWLMNRHRSFLVLYEAWELSGDFRYIEKIRSLWMDWIDSNPYPDGLTFSAPWRALETARRILEVWIPLCAAFEDEGLWTPELRERVEQSLPDHGDALHEHASFWGGNHYLTEKTALLALSMTWPELPEAGEWREAAIDDFSRALQKQVYPDGAHKELSHHYQRVVLLSASTFLDFLPAGHPAEETLLGLVNDMWTYFFALTRPNGHGPLNNGADWEYSRAYLDRARKTTGRSFSDATSLKDRFFPWSGVGILARDDNWAYFDLGPLGTAHGHADALHLSIDFGCTPFLVDNGRYHYRPDQWKNYFTGPRGHNVFTVNGNGPAARPREVDQPRRIRHRFEESHAVIQAGSLYRHNGPLRHLRTLIDLREGHWLVVDDLVVFTPVTGRWHWHFYPEWDRGTISRHVDLRSTSPLQSKWFQGSEDPVAGWFSPDYNVREPAWEWQVSGTLRQPTRIIWEFRRESGRDAGKSFSWTGNRIEVSTGQSAFLLKLPEIGEEILPEIRRVDHSDE